MEVDNSLIEVIGLCSYERNSGGSCEAEIRGRQVINLYVICIEESLLI